MAIRIVRDWHSIIINVEKANEKIEGGLVALLYSYYPSMVKTQKNGSSIKSFNFIRKILGKTQNINSAIKYLALDDFDNMHFSSGIEVFGGNGCDGNLYFMSYCEKDKIDSYIKDLESKGLVSNRMNPDCDFYVYDDNEERAHLCKWLHLLMKEEPCSDECIESSYAYFSIYPFCEPSQLQGGVQGDISYDSQYVWEQYQKLVCAENAKGMKDLSDIQIRHLNARLWDKEIPNIDVFIKAYLNKDESGISPKYRYIIDGSKDTDDTKQNILTYNNPLKVPVVERNISEQMTTDIEFLMKLAEAYQTYNASIIEPYLANDMHYASTWVFDEMTSKSEYLDYFVGKLQALKKHGLRIEFELVKGRLYENALLITNQTSPDGSFGFVADFNQEGKVKMLNMTLQSFF